MRKTGKIREKRKFFRVCFLHTLMSRINVPIRFLILERFSCQYAPYSGQYDYLFQRIFKSICINIKSSNIFKKGHGKYLPQLADISSRSLKMKPVTVRLSLRVFSGPEFCAESDFEGIFDILTPLNHQNSKKKHIFAVFSQTHH